MIYEIYNQAGIAMAIEFSGTLKELVSLIGSSYLLYGKSKDGREECAFVDCGRNVMHVCESDSEEWSNYIIIPGAK